MTTQPVSPHARPREIEVLRLVAEGYTNPQIASRLFMATSTVRQHLYHVAERWHTRNRAHAAAIAVQSGLVKVEVPGWCSAVALPPRSR